MQNLFGYAGLQVADRGVLRYYIGDARWCWVDADDIADVAAAVLRAPAAHAGRTYRLGYDAESFAEIAAIIADVIGQPYRYEARPPEEFLETILKAGGEPAYMSCVYDSFSRLSHGGIRGSDQTFDNFASITGRPPTTIQDFVVKHAAKISLLAESPLMSQAPTLNDPIRIGALTLANRVIMAPLTRSRAGAAGVPGALNVEYYVQRASAGLIITEATNIGPLSCAFECAPGIWRADQVEGWRSVTEAVHGNGGRIFLQLWHGGRVSAKGLLAGRDPVSPSGVNDDLDALEVWAQLANGHYVKIKATPSRALSTGEVEGIVEEYRVSAANAKDRRLRRR